LNTNGDSQRDNGEEKYSPPKNLLALNIPTQLFEKQQEREFDTSQ